MPYVNKPRPYKHEYQLQKARGEGPERLERQRAREAIDKKNYDDPKDKDKTAEIREGKDVAHKKALSKGGSNKQGVMIQSASENRSFKRGANHKVVSEISARERKKKK